MKVTPRAATRENVPISSLKPGDTFLTSTRIAGMLLDPDPFLRLLNLINDRDGHDDHDGSQLDDKAKRAVWWVALDTGEVRTFEKPHEMVMPCPSELTMDVPVGTAIRQGEPRALRVRLHE